MLSYTDMYDKRRMTVFYSYMSQLPVVLITEDGFTICHGPQQ
jgi:hypothetical protein